MKKATLSENNPLDTLSPLGQELFQLMEQIPENQRLTEQQINQEIAPRRGADRSASIHEFVTTMESLAEEDAKPLPADFSRQDIYFSEE